MNDMPDFALALLLKPFVLLAYVWLIAGTIWLAHKLPDCRLKRLLLIRIEDIGSGRDSSGSLSRRK